TAMRRLVGETAEPMQRARLLPAHVEIMLAAGDRDAARRACAELGALAANEEHGMLGALAAHADGAVRLADGDTPAALVALRRAARAWQELGVPYQAAR